MKRRRRKSTKKNVVPEEIPENVKKLTDIFFSCLAKRKGIPEGKIRLTYKDNGQFNSVNYPKQYLALINLSKVFEESNINPEDYMLWGLAKLNTRYKLWPSSLYSTEWFTEFSKISTEKLQNLKIVEFYDETCKHLSKICIDLKLNVQECIKHLLSSGLFEIYIQSGIISKYWLSIFSINALHKILKFINDPNAKERLKEIIKNRDKIYVDIYDAFLQKYNIEVNPFKRVEYFINKSNCN